MCPTSASVQWMCIVRQSSRDCIGKQMLANFLHEIAECGKCSELTRGEEITVLCHTIDLNTETKSFLWKVGYRYIGCRNGMHGNTDMVIIRRKINTPTRTLSNNHHKLCTHTADSTLT